MRSVEEVKEDIRKLEDELEQIKVAEWESVKSEREKLIGMCFKYKNSYDNIDGFWMVYVKIISIGRSEFGDGMFYNVVSFERDSYGRLLFERRMIWKSVLDNWQLITDDEYNAEKGILIKRALDIDKI